MRFQMNGNAGKRSREEMMLKDKVLRNLIRKLYQLTLRIQLLENMKDENWSLKSELNDLILENTKLKRQLKKLGNYD